jgi:hypothetical protein
MDDIIRPKRLKLYNALEIGYLRNEAKQKKRLKRFGYKLVPDLTNREHTVAFNPVNQKLLYISNGTDFSNLRDVKHDVMGAVGAQRSSSREKEERNALLKAKQELKPKEVVLVSHSLGSQYTNYIAGSGDKVIQYNPYYTAGAKSRGNVENYRTRGDLVSMFSPAENTTTLNVGGLAPVQAHGISQIRDAPIYV